MSRASALKQNLDASSSVSHTCHEEHAKVTLRAGKALILRTAQLFWQGKLELRRAWSDYELTLGWVTLHKLSKCKVLAA